VTTVGSSGSTAAVTYSGLNVIPTVNLTGTSASLTATLGATAVVGLADAMTINLSAVGSTADATVTVNGVENITVNASGVGAILANGTSVGAIIASDALRSLTVVGTGQTVLEANMAGAGTGTTGVTATIVGSAGADIFSVRVPAAASKLSADFGAGDDTVDITRADAAQTIAGGAGTDTLIYAGTAAAAATATANITGFENVIVNTGVSFALATSNVTYTAAAVAATYTGLAAGGTVALEAGGTLTLANTALTGTTDAVTVTVGTAALTAPTPVTINAGTFDVVTVNGVARSDTSAALSAAISVSGTTLNTVNLNSSQGVVLAGGGTALTTINASGVAGNFSVGTLATSTTAGLTITTGAGNDVITGGALGDSLNGGAGNDTITGGVGADTMTGGAGADTFTIAANTALALSSSATTTDTITDFTSGTDKLNVGAAAFLGNFTNIQQALAAQGAAGTVANSAAFVSGENSLYVFNNTNGTLNVLDTIVRLTGVTALSGPDLLIGSQGTGNAVTLTAAAALSTNASSNTLASGVTSAANDTVTAPARFLAGSTLTGGLGDDTLALSMNASTATSGGGTATLTSDNLANVSGFEFMTLASFVPAVADDAFTYNIALNPANIAANSTLTVTSSYSGLRSDGFTTGGNLVFDANLIVDATSRLNFTGAAANDSVRGGAGNDTINGGAGNDTILGGDGADSLSGGAGNDEITAGAGADTIDGGAGNDTITFAANLTVADIVTGGAGTDTLTVTNPAAAAATAFDNVTGVEAITFTAVDGAAPGADADDRARNVVTISANSAFALDTTAVTFTSAEAQAVALNFSNLTRGITIVTGSRADVIGGGAGNDVINGAAGDDSMVGNAGDDTFIIAAAADHAAGETITGGTGNDTIRFTSTGASETLALSANVTDVDNVLNVVIGTAAGVTTGTETLGLVATALAGTLAVNVTGNDGINAVLGTANADTVSGNGGNDVISSAAGADSVSGGAGDDRFGLTGRTETITVTRADATDTYIVTVNGVATAAQTVAAGANNAAHHAAVAIQIRDAINATTATSFVTATAEAAVVTLTYAHNFGQAATIAITDVGAGDASTAAVLVTGAGDNAGNDTISGGLGADIVLPGSGNNTVDLTEASASIDTVRLTAAGTGNVTTVTGFAQANDVMSLTASAFTPTGRAAAGTFSNTDGDDITGATTQVFVTAGTSTGTVDASAVDGVLKLTGAAGSFGAALGTTVVTLDATVGANELITALFYDSVNGQLVIGAVDSSTDGVIGNITQNDTFFEMARVTMTAADFALFNVANLTYFG
jgi:Ca2+-binding RTX toxin-like protein